MSAIDGLVSGMDTTSLIKQLMQLERLPAARLQTKKALTDKAITALQGLNTKFSALAELAKKFGVTAGTWTAGGAKSSHPANVGVQVAPGTTATTLSVTVKSLAAAHTVRSATAFATTADKIADKDDPITFNYLDTNGAATSVTITRPHDGSLQGVADAINASSTAPATAAVVYDSVAAGYRLAFTAKRTGDFSGFNVTGIQRGATPAMTFNTVVSGTDAEVAVGTGDFQKTITSTSNVIEAAPGITLALKVADPLTAVTITITEATKPADDVQKLVDSANEILKEIKALTAYDSATKKPGLLQGDMMLRGLQNDVLRAVYEAVGGDTVGSAGLELTRDGMLAFDKGEFDVAYAADPARVTALFTRTDGLVGVAQRLATVAETATKFGTGPIAHAIGLRRSETQRIDDSLATWDVRLARKEAALRRQFASLEAALGAAQQQGNWLASQIANLPTSSA